MVTIGPPHVWGIQPIKPLIGFPDGKVKLRLRNRDFARVFVKTPEGARCFLVKESEDKAAWIPGFEQGRNWRRTEMLLEQRNGWRREVYQPITEHDASA